MKYLFTILCAVFCLNASFAAENAKFGKWRKPSFFRGFNVSNLKLKTQQDLIDMRSAGANLAQIGCFGFQSAYAPYEEKPFEIASIDSLVSYCREAGVYYTIAVRQGPGRRDVSFEQNDVNARSTIWTSEAEQNLYAGMLRRVVERYRDDSLFVGINAFMEPNPLFYQISVNPASLATALANAGIDMKKIYAKMIDSVRSADTELPVIIQSVSYSSPEFFSLVPQVNDPYAVYEFHCYRPSEFVKSDKQNSMSYPGSYFSLNDLGFRTYNRNFFEMGVFAPIRAFQEKSDAPVFMGEFGLATEQNGGELLLNDVTDIAVRSGWHFAYWEYRGNESLWNYETLDAKYWATVKGSFQKQSVASAVSEDEEDIFAFSISQGNGMLTGKFNLERNSRITVELYSSEARKVMEIFNAKEFGPGSHSFEIDPSRLSSGVYFVELSDGERNASKKFSIAR